ncbi:hypothetical protein HMPREF1982_01578 [Clostridiales bacterium oral taxon 876 str. F0540]|nr:hypothetical protein HMPREF1982_01578 [Clostridiales bacterium oral taxon 876 str. F0540]
MGEKKKRVILGIIIVLIVTLTGLNLLLHKGRNLKSTDEFVKELKSRNYKVESIEDVTKNRMSWFSGNEKIIKCSNIELLVFEFTSVEEASNEASRVSKDGFKIKPLPNASGSTPLAVYIGWGDNPHFYRSGKLIVLYCGTNLKVQYDLNRILGRQFAGFEWYIPGKKH